MSAKKFQPNTVLVIPDVHAKGGDKLERLRALRAYLQRHRTPLSHVVQIGDLWSFDSLCQHDKETPEWYKRNLGADWDAGCEGLQIIKSIADRANCEVTVTEGNHEYRYNNWMKSDNRLLTSDFPKTVSAALKRAPVGAGVRYVPFQTPFVLNDTAFIHYAISGLMNRAVGGERPAGTILRTQFMSTVVGHSHVLDFAERTRADGRKIQALVSGCFIDPAADFSYAGAARKLWWNGVQLLHYTAPGVFDIEMISIDRL
jgi:hypothetical protein